MYPTPHSFQSERTPVHRAISQVLALTLIAWATAAVDLHAGSETPPERSPVSTPVLSDRTAANEPTLATDPPERNRENPGQTDGTTSGSLQLRLNNPTLSVAENRAYIPLLFTLEGSTDATNDLRVRATWVGGTATPGEDFSSDTAERVVPVPGGLHSLNWVEVPLIQDDVNEGTEVALFDLSIDGSTNPPVRMQVEIVDDLTLGEVGFVSSRFSSNEGSTNGVVELRFWRTLNTRGAATVTYRLEGSDAALALLGGQSSRTATFQAGESQLFTQIPLVNNTDAQGPLDITLTILSSDDGMKPIQGLGAAVLTLGDDETLPPPAPLSIQETTSEDGQRGVALSTMVPRGYQVRLEYSDTGATGPWNLYWIFEGADVERMTFNSFDSSLNRLFRIQPPEPLDRTFPW